jgi:Flp pilus assembly protein TadG
VRGLRRRSFGAPAGNAVIEVAIALSFLMMVLFGIIDFGRAWWSSNIMHTACREGARLAAVSAQSDSVTVIARVREVLNTAAINPDPSDIKLFWPTPGDPTDPVTVEINYDFDLIAGPVLGIIPGTIPLSARCAMRYEAVSSP